ncbi:hypothetical protein [Halochromatium salexigens]|nr:hypothetical protein [Halochromatium salexigens]
MQPIGERTGGDAGGEQEDDGRDTHPPGEPVRRQGQHADADE